MNRIKLWCCLSVLLLPSLLYAQASDRMKTAVQLDPLVGAPGDTLKLTLHFEVEAGFHTYAVEQVDANAKVYATTFRVKAGPLEPGGPIKEPAPHVKQDTDLQATIATHEGTGDFEVPFKIKPGTPPGKTKVHIRFTTQVCSTSCQPHVEDFHFDIEVKEGKATTAPSLPVKQSAPVKQEGNGQPATPSKQNEPPQQADPLPERSLLSVLVEAGGLGFLALLTPCVFPMIPITVSYFLKQKQGSNALGHSFVYTGTIVISLAIFIYAFVDFAQKLNYHWATNLCLGLLLMIFALSLFGMFEIRLPTALSNWTSAGENRGGYLGTIFMALTFMIISFSCVSPIVGVLAGLAAEKRPLLWNVLTALVFASCFAFPFFVLSLFPAMLKKLPKSGGWLNSLKIILGLLEVAAALKFFRQSELIFKGNQVDFLTYDFVLALYCALCFAGGMYLLRRFRMPHDDEDYQNKSVGVARFMWALLFIALGLYLIPGMYWAPTGQKHRPAGRLFAWVDAFLLQGDDTQPLKISGGGASSELKWSGFLEEGIKEAKTARKRIFIDFTGISCQNCALNEKNIFSREEVKDALKEYTLVKLYTDTVPLPYYPSDKLANITVDIQEADGEKHRLFEKARFNTTELPFYVVVDIKGDEIKEVARYSVGLIKNKDEFLKFLRDHRGSAPSEMIKDKDKETIMRALEQQTGKKP